LEILGDYSKPQPFPDAERSKNYKWFLQVARGCLHLYQTNRMGVGFGGICLKTKKPIHLKRSYLYNQQSIDRIRDELDPLDTKTNTRVYSIDWSKADFHTKTLNNAASKIMAYRYAPKTVAIDEGSVFQKTTKANKAKLLAHPEIKDIAQQIGYKSDDSMNVENPEDIDMLQELGGIRLEYEIQLKNAVEHSLKDSDFELTLQKMWIDDLMCDNRIIATVETDPSTGRPVVKYGDIATSFYTPSKYTDSRDMSSCGYIERMSIPTLRAYLQRQKDKGDTKYLDVEKTLLEICKKYSGRFDGNTFISDFNNYGALEYYNQNGYYPYDHFGVHVGTFWIIASDTKTYVKGIVEDGYMQFNRVSNKPKDEKETDDTKSIKNTTQNVYRVRMVIGTDYIFDYGVDDVIVREGAKGNKRAVLPMIVYSSPQSSLIDRIMPKIDEINKVEFKERHLLTQMIPEPAYMVDMSLLDEFVMIGGQEYDQKKILDYFHKKGRLFYRSKNEWGEQEGGSQRPPIDFINQPAVRQILELAQRKALLIQELKDMVGVNDIADGTQSSAELLVGVTQNSNQAVNNALMPFILGYRQFCNNIGKMVMRKYEVMLQAGEEISGVFFSDNVRKDYKLSKTLLSESPEFAFFLEMSPTYEEKQQMTAFIGAAYQRGELSTSEMMICQDYINNDDIKAAQYFMAKAEKKRSEMQHKQQMETVQGQAQAQGDSAIKAEQAKTDSQIAIDNNKAKNDENLLRVKHDLDMTSMTETHKNAKDLQTHTTDNSIMQNAIQSHVDSTLQPQGM